MIKGTPCLELFKSEHLLKNVISLELNMFPASNEFVLMTANKDGYSTNIVDCTLRVCFIELIPEFLEVHDRVLAENQLAYYPLIIMDTKTFSILAGLSSYSIENPWLNQVPSDIYVAFIEADKFLWEN